MEDREQLDKALEALRQFVCALAVQAEQNEGYGEQLWQGIRQSGGLLQELAYYHDHGEFLCRYEVAGYTLADVLVWQVDHFKAYLDRRDEVNRWRPERLLLHALDVLLQMEVDPWPFIAKMQGETGTDYVGKFKEY